MKFTTILTTLAFAFATAHATDCTTSQMTEAMIKPEFLALTTACTGVKIDPTKSDASQTKLICANAACLTAIEAAAKVIPACEYQGKQLSASFTQVIDECKKTGTTTSSAAAGAASVASTVVAVVAIVAAYARA